jgi:hypothetical protein
MAGPSGPSPRVRRHGKHGLFWAHSTGTVHVCLQVTRELNSRRTCFTRSIASQSTRVRSSKRFSGSPTVPTSRSPAQNENGRSLQLTRDGASPSSPLRVRSLPPFPGNREGLFFCRMLTIDRPSSRSRMSAGAKPSPTQAGACLCRRGHDEEAATRRLLTVARALHGSEGASSKALLRAPSDVRRHTSTSRRAPTRMSAVIAPCEAMPPRTRRTSHEALRGRG